MMTNNAKDNKVTTSLLSHSIKFDIKAARKSITDASGWNESLMGDDYPVSINVTLNNIDMHIHSAIDELGAIRDNIKAARKLIS